MYCKSAECRILLSVVYPLTGFLRNHLKIVVMEANKSMIRKVVVVLAVILTILSAALVINRKESEIRKLNSQTTTLNRVVVERDSVLNDLFTTFNDIESSLDFIKQRSGRIEFVQDEDQLPNRRESIVNDLRLLDSLLERNSEKVRILEARLKKSGIQVAALNKRITQLNQDIHLQSKEILRLKQQLEERELQIAQLNSKVDGLESEVQMNEQDLLLKTAIIKKQDSALNKAFLVYGTYKELKDNGVVEREGGLLGLGGVKTVSGDVDETIFLKLDIRETREIPLYAKKANFITEHPDSSYRFLMDEGLITYLEIEDPEEFWKRSKYAVIETK